jgi:hypothetical protein
MSEKGSSVEHKYEPEDVKNLIVQLTNLAAETEQSADRLDRNLGRMSETTTGSRAEKLADGLRKMKDSNLKLSSGFTAFFKGMQGAQESIIRLVNASNGQAEKAAELLAKI